MVNQSTSSTGTITFSGLASGIDTSSIVSQLMALERMPEQVLTKRKTPMQSQVSAYNQLSSALTSLQSLMAGMNTVNTFAAKTASVADSSVASATASNSAPAGAHTLMVASLARSQTLVSESPTNSGYASDTAQNFGTGTITLANSIDPQNSVIVNIDNTNNSLQGIATAINASGANVTASVVNDGSDTPFRLVIIGKDTGTYSVTSGLTGGTYDAPTFDEKVSSSKAHFQLDGIDMSRTTNAIADAIPGVTMTLQKSNDPLETTVTTGNDIAGVTTKINNFISSYNNVMNLINQNTSYDATTKSAGVLFSDPTIRTVLHSLQTILTNRLSGATGTFSSLADIGITSDKNTGLLSADSSRLSGVLSSDFNSVISLFTQNTGKPGLAQSNYGIAEEFNRQINSLINPYTGNGAGNNGIIPTRIQGLSNNMAYIDKQVAAMEVRMTTEENSLKARFTAMEKTLSNTSAWGNALLAGLGISSSKSTSS